MIQGLHNHPILQEFFSSEFDFHLTGSRVYSDKKPKESGGPYQATDYDFFIDVSGSLDQEGGYWGTKEAVEKFLGELGFKEKTVGGYSVDRDAYHWAWFDPEKNLPGVDVLLLHSTKEELPFRNAVIRKFKSHYGALLEAVRRDKKAWADLFSILDDAHRGEFHKGEK